MRNGRRDVESRLPALVYAELKRLASSHLRRERRGHTLQATDLVNEAYLRLADNEAPWQNQAHFFGAAARAMRRILVDHARARDAQKRGDGQVKVSFRADSPGHEFPRAHAVAAKSTVGGRW